MGLRFRKSIKIAPGVKVNLNKNSASVSVGTKGKHYTVNSNGKTTKTVGIPGTGLSYSTTSGGGNKKTPNKSKSTAVSKNRESKKKNGCAGCLTSFLVVFGILFILFMIIPSGDKKDDAKNPLGFDVDFSSSYRNDVTGKWRLARIAENKTIEEYALDYYRNYFESDDEIHIIINFTLNTTNRILVWGNLLDVATMEYVDNEEHDAKIACSGMLLSEYLINTDTGEIEKIQPASENSNIEGISEDISIEQTEQERIAAEQAEAERIAAEQADAERIAQEQAEAERIAAEQANQTQSNDNASQQQTTSNYVLNTNTMKFHSPGCKSVKEIAPQNYSTYDGTRDDIINQGYSPCGNCKP